MIHKFLKAAGVKTESEFYAKYPNEEDFFKQFPKFRDGGIKVSYDNNGINVPSRMTEPIPTPLPLAKTGTAKTKRGVSFEKLIGPGDKPYYSPKFTGFNDSEINNYWSNIPESFNGSPVLRGDAWRDMQTNAVQPSPINRVNQPQFVNNQMINDNGSTHAVSYYPTNQNKWMFANGGEIDPNNNSGGLHMNFNTMGLIQGADMLATGLYNNHIRQSEAQMMRDQLMPVTSPTNFRGLDQDIVSMGMGGSMVEPNALVEGGEVIQTPDGVTQDINGQKHNDREDGMGGTVLNLPDQTKIYSDQIKLDKKIASDIMERKITKKMTPAQLAKKFDTKKFEKVLLDKGSDSLAKRTASIMKEKHETKLSQIFDAQESMKPVPTSQQMFAFGGETGDDRKYAPHEPLVLNGLGPEPDFNTVKSKFDNIIFGRPQEAISQSIPSIRNQNMSLSSTSIPTTLDNSSNIPTSERRSSFLSKAANMLGKGLGHVAEYAPEGLAMINAMTQSPVQTAKFQPKYLGEMPGLDISAQLGRNYSQVRGAMSSTGNASIDAARNAQLIANLGDTNNEVFNRKYQSDSAQRFQRDEYNNQLENNANMTNLQRADTAWDKITQRKANQNQAMQGVVDSAYRKAKSMQMEKESMRVAQELYPNYKYNGGQGYEFVPGPNGQVFVRPVGSGSYIQPNDGVRTTITKDNKGKITKRDREDSNG